MKKIIAIAAAALLFVGCGSTKNYVVEGTIEGFTGQVAVMDMNGEMILGLATTTDGSFEMEVENDGSGLQMGMLTLSQSPVAPIFLDGSEILVEGNTYGGIIISGTEANDAYNAYVTASQEFAGTLPEDFDPQAASEEDAKLIADFLMAQYEENTDNLLGAFLILSGNVPALTPEEFLSCIDMLSDDVKAFAPIVEMRGYVEQAIAEQNAAAEAEEESAE